MWCAMPMSWAEPSVIILIPLVSGDIELIPMHSCNVLAYRLQLSACGDGVLYCPSGEVVRRWRWGGGEVEREGLFQPLCLSLNKQLLLQCTGRDQLLITFSLGQRRVKFTILRKLKEVYNPSVFTMIIIWTHSMLQRKGWVLVMPPPSISLTCRLELSEDMYGMKRHHCYIHCL